MRMGKNNRINFARRDRGVLPVALAPFFLSLEKSAVDQNLESLFATRIVGGVDQVLRARHGPGSAEKLDVGQALSLRKNNLPRSLQIPLCNPVLPVVQDFPYPANLQPQSARARKS